MEETDLEWLDRRLRSIHRVRSNGESKDEDMLICNMVFHGHLTVQLKVWYLADLIEKGKEYERLHSL